MRSARLTRRRMLQYGAASVLGVAGSQYPAEARHQRLLQRIFASSKDVPLLQLPEGLTATATHVFVGTYNYLNPKDSRIFAFDANTGELQNTIGGKPGQELVSAGGLL